MRRIRFNACWATALSFRIRGVSPDEEIAMIFLGVDAEARSYPHGERRRPDPKPADWMSTGQARLTIDVRDHHRAIRAGREFAEQVAPGVATNIAPKIPLFTHAPETPSSNAGRVSSLGS